MVKAFQRLVVMQSIHHLAAARGYDPAPTYRLRTVLVVSSLLVAVGVGIVAAAFHPLVVGTIAVLAGAGWRLVRLARSRRRRRRQRQTHQVCVPSTDVCVEV